MPDIDSLEKVVVRYIDTRAEIAAITKADGRQIGINLWELSPFSRNVDGFSNWKYQTNGKIRY